MFAKNVNFLNQQWKTILDISKAEVVMKIYIIVQNIYSAVIRCLRAVRSSISR